jgi:hypothetical protein
VVLQRPKGFRSRGEPFERADPLAEDDRLPPAGGDFVQVGRSRSSFALAPVAGSKLQICFSRSTSSKTCWIVIAAHLAQPHDALVFSASS